MKLALVPLLVCGTLATNAFAADIYQNFIILEASNLSPAGGTFSTGGSYFGTFSVDESIFPTVSFQVPLANVEVTTTTAGSIPGANYTSGAIAFGHSFLLGSETLDEYEVLFTLPGSQLELDFVEVPNTFAGGQIISAHEQELSTPPFSSRNDTSGDAVTIDPAFVVPEPGSSGMGGLGLAILAGAWCGRKYSIRASLLEPSPAGMVQKTK